VPLAAAGHVRAATGTDGGASRPHPARSDATTIEQTSPATRKGNLPARDRLHDAPGYLLRDDVGPLRPSRSGPKSMPNTR